MGKDKALCVYLLQLGTTVNHKAFHITHFEQFYNIDNITPNKRMFLL